MPALRRASQARQPLREELASCSACAQQAEDLQHSRTGHALMMRVERHTQCMPGSALFNRQPHPVACGRMVKAFCFATTTTLSPTVTMRSASEVDAAIEAACAGDSHGAQTPVSAIGRGRWGRRRRVQARTAAASRSALQHVSTFSHGFEPITRRTSLSVFSLWPYSTVSARGASAESTLQIGCPLI